MKETGFLLKVQYCQGITDHKRIHLKKAGNKLMGKEMKMLLCTFQLLKRFPCLIAQDLVLVTAAIAAAVLDRWVIFQRQNQNWGHPGGISTLTACCRTKLVVGLG